MTPDDFIAELELIRKSIGSAGSARVSVELEIDPTDDIEVDEAAFGLVDEVIWEQGSVVVKAC